MDLLSLALIWLATLVAIACAILFVGQKIGYQDGYEQCKKDIAKEKQDELKTAAVIASTVAKFGAELISKEKVNT